MIGRMECVTLLLKIYNFGSLNDTNNHNSKFQTLAIINQELKLTVINLYNPPTNHLTSDTWVAAISSYEEPKIILGDLNADHNL